MRVLYLHNTAGVFTPVINWLNTHGHQSKVCIRSFYDKYQHSSRLDCAVVVNGGAKSFYLASIRLIRSFKPDLIHISGSLELLAIARFFAWRTPIVMTFHGSDIRNPEHKIPKTARLADFIHVTTPDLQPYGVWIDRPLDESFHYRGGRVPNSALMFYSERFYKDKRQEAKVFCEARGIDLTILDTTAPDFLPIPNDQMPEYLSKFQYLLDWKDQLGELYALSKIALEAIACGVLVLHDEHPRYPILSSRIKIERPEAYLRLYRRLTRATRVHAIKRLPRLVISLLKLVFRGLTLRNDL